MIGTGRILIVEDEPLIAMMLEDFLESLDCTVAGQADCVADALALVSRGDFDAVVLDVNLRGGELSWPIADALAAAGKPFLIASGGSTDPSPPRHAAAPLLAKPYTMAGVRAALAALPR